jgi:hypothetical protein
MKRAASPWRGKGTKQRMEKNGILVIKDFEING